MTTITKVVPGDTTTFEQVLAIYQDSIERSEQKSADAIAALVADSHYDVLAASDQSGVTGFAMSFFPSDGGFWLLEYMAISVRCRSSGIGRTLFQGALAAGSARAGGHPCVLEVDQPGGIVSATNDPVKRLRFYARQGCRRLEGLDYILPLETAGKPPAMHLLVHGLDGQNEVSRATVHRWLEVIYLEVYGCAAQDPRIDTMLSRLGDSVPLVGL